MKHRAFFAAASAALIIMLALGSVTAQGPIIESLPGGGWWVSWSVMNVGSADANLSVEALPSDTQTGGPYTLSLTLPKGQVTTFIPGDLNKLTPDLPDGFIGSAVVSSDQQIVAVAAISNETYKTLGIAGGKARGQYQGIDGTSAAQEVRFPVVKNGWCSNATTFNVQAAGAAASVTMRYFMNNGQTYTEGPVNLLANQMHTFSPSVAGVPSTPTCSNAESAAVLGSAVATSTTGNIAGVVTEHPAANTTATWLMSTRGATSQDADNTVAIPVIKWDWYNNTSGLSVQNADSSPATVHTVFTVAGRRDTSPAGCAKGAIFTPTDVTIQPGKSYVYYPTLNNMGGFPQNCYGSAIVTSTGGKVVATLNDESSSKKTLFSGFALKNATSRIAFPVVKEDWYNRTSGVVVQNLEATPTTVTIVYRQAGKAPSGTPPTVTLSNVPIDAKGSLVLYRVWRETATYGPSVAQLVNTYGGVEVTSNNGARIVGIAQEEGYDSSPAGTLDNNNYEGFNLQP